MAGHCARSDSSQFSSSISRLRFAEQEPCSLPIRTHCSLLQSGSQLSRKSERLHHLTGRASAVCRTFEMTYVVRFVYLLDYDIKIRHVGALLLNIPYGLSLDIEHSFRRVISSNSFCYYLSSVMSYL